MMDLDRREMVKAMYAILAVPSSAFAGLFAADEPTRPMRSKPYIEEGRPEYEEPPAGEGSPFLDMDNLTCRWIIDPDGYPHLIGPRPDEQWAALGLEKPITHAHLREALWKRRHH